MLFFYLTGYHTWLKGKIYFSFIYGNLTLTDRYRFIGLVNRLTRLLQPITSAIFVEVIETSDAMRCHFIFA